MNSESKNKTLITYNKNGSVEEIEEIEIYSKIQKRHFKKGEFYMEHKSLDDLILKNEYNGLTVRVLIALKQRLDFNNRIKGFRQIELAEQLKTSQANISRSLKTLEQDKIIIKDGIDYYFNTTYIKGAGDTKAKSKGFNYDE